MSLDAFLYHLQFGADKITPPDWVVDWADAPLPYKLYRGLPTYPLPCDVPLTLDGTSGPVQADLRGVGQMLWYAFGLTQVICTEFMPMYRRSVPSGGGLFPSEVYVYLKLEELPEGVYHYDAAHHRLVLLREGKFDSYLERALGGGCQVATCFGAVLVSTVFWKNFFKYNNFAYRLQGLDAGALIGQWLEVAKRCGVETGVHFQFLDRALNHLLGLSEQEESVYAVLPLAVQSGAFERQEVGAVTSAELCAELPAVQHESHQRSQRIRPYPLLIRMNEASMLTSTASFQKVDGKQEAADAGALVSLPHVKRVAYDLAHVCRERFSPGETFVRRIVSDRQLAALLQEATASFAYRNDLGGPTNVSIYGCLYGVQDVPNGAYRYDRAAHALELVRPGDHREWLQQGMVGTNLNLSQVPLNLHVVGERDHYTSQLGYRGYRIQQMEAGMMVQRLVLSAVALGMGAHPLLGFNAGMSDHLYHAAAKGKTSLIQLPIGPYRLRSQWRGQLIR